MPVSSDNSLCPFIRAPQNAEESSKKSEEVRELAENRAFEPVPGVRVSLGSSGFAVVFSRQHTRHSAPD